MPRLRFLLGVTTATVVVLVHPSAARSQERPYQGTFEGAGVDSARRILGASLAVAGGYDDLSQPDSPVLADQFQLPGYFLTVAPMATFQSKSTHAGISVDVGTNGRYYDEARRFVSVNHYGVASVAAQITPRTDLFVGVSASYSPAYLNRLFSSLGPANTLDPATADPLTTGDLTARTTDEGLSRVHSYAYGTTLNLTRKIGRRASVTLTGGGRYTRFVHDQPEIPDLHGLEGGGYYLYSLERNVSLRVGYEYRIAHFTPTQDSAEHVVDIGFGVTHRWSKTRRTFFAISAGPRAARQSVHLTTIPAPGADGEFVQADAASPPAAANPLAPAQPGPQVSFVAGALFDHQMGRTWTVHGGVHRDVAYIEALASPVFSNTIDLGTSGFVTPRVDVTASIGHSYGDSTFSIRVPSPFTAYKGYVRVRAALGRRWAGYTEYVYDAYDFGGDVPVPLGIPRNLKRAGVRVGLMLWVPVVRRR